MDFKKYLSISQYAARQGICRQRVQQLVQADRIPGAVRAAMPGARGGRIWLIPRGAKISPPRYRGRPPKA